MKYVFCIFIALGCLFASPGVRAEDAADKAIARQLFDEAVTLMEAGKAAEACPKLEASLKRYGGVGTRGKLAECYEAVGRIASAWAMYRETAVLAGKAGDSAREQIAGERARQLEPKIAYVIFQVTSAADVPGLTLKTKNGDVLERALAGSKIPIDPGKFTLEVSAPGYVSKTISSDVAAAAVVNVDIPVLVAAPKTTGAPGSDAPQATWQKPVGLALGGAGVVGLALGAVFGLSASSTYDGAFDSGQCNRATKTCSVAGQAETESARSKATASTIFFVAGVVLAGAGVTLFLTAPKNKEKSATATKLVPLAGPSVAGAMLSGSF